MMPEITLRSSTRRAPGWFFGKCGSMAAQASSDSQNNERDILKASCLSGDSLEPKACEAQSMCTLIFKMLIGFGP